MLGWHEMSLMHIGRQQGQEEVHRRSWLQIFPLFATLKCTIFEISHTASTSRLGLAHDFSVEGNNGLFTSQVPRLKNSLCAENLSIDLESK